MPPFKIHRILGMKVLASYISISISCVSCTPLSHKSSLCCIFSSFYKKKKKGGCRGTYTKLFLLFACVFLLLIKYRLVHYHIFIFQWQNGNLACLISFYLLRYISKETVRCWSRGGIVFKALLMKFGFLTM